MPAPADLQASLRQTAAEVEATLETLLPPAGEDARGRLAAAMRHAVLAGGKRLRPVLLLQAAELCGARRVGALRAAAAFEMLHCYSLAHDDLPAMDDADLRRGRPSLHRAFDEATAILAGDALLTEAFALLADPLTHPDAAVRCRLVALLAAAAGAEGMVGGQALDLAAEESSLDLHGIEELQALKTGALIEAACRAGALLGGAAPAEEAALAAFARKLGLAFQIVDDLLDWEGTADSLGKPAGRDSVQGKATFPALLGRDEARAKAGDLVRAARRDLEVFGRRADFLGRVADFVLERRS